MRRAFSLPSPGLDFQSARESQTVTARDPSPLWWEVRQEGVLLAMGSGSHVQRQGDGNIKRARATRKLHGADDQEFQSMGSSMHIKTKTPGRGDPPEGS